MNNFFITTGRRTDGNCIVKAHSLAEKYNMHFIYRNNEPLAQIKKRHDCQTVIIVKKERISIVTSSGELFFHPNMAQLRIKRLLKNEKDNMLTAMALKKGMSVLDCTLGFAADALISAFKSGTLVIGLEADPLLALIAEEGLRAADFSVKELTKAAHNIKVINVNHEEYLQKLPDKSIDVVYFDPMFRHPLMDSLSLTPLRILADTAPVTKKSIDEACRIAKHRVVLKENSKSNEFDRLGFSSICGGRYSPVHYGIIEIGKYV
ncbi:class I SAM-dependent methyltransferase [Pectinatus haikarae]|uniref:16S rRNA G966 N2-methylase RsmD n=1 Tax=Pectinatus haikarae TaxID=349096 RepID=A0ABT9Y6X2_9FIRM|nr:class I SAM-dependent methyltransferase [Pectinatus haikarae]MDQ0203398.1 16S rRNA G966 N2-methylase RsmD [Pectinatus haikarae]